MERIRVEIRRTSGSSYYVSTAKAAELVQKKLATWLDDRRNCALASVTSSHGTFDASRVVGPRAIWRMTPSDGFSVMQLT